MNNDPSYHSLLTAKQTAQYLNISVRTLANWRSVGHPHLEHTRVGRTVRYYKSGVDYYLAKHTVPSTED